MNDKNKTQTQLLEENQKLRLELVDAYEQAEQRIAELYTKAMSPLSVEKLK